MGGGQRHLWLDVEVGIDERLDVMAWGRGEKSSLSPLYHCYWWCLWRALLSSLARTLSR